MKLPRLSTAVAAAPALSLAWTARALAATGEKTPLHLDKVDPGRSAAAPSAGGSLARTFIGLAIVVAVIYGLYWVLKQVKASREERASGSGLTSLATLPLGQNRALHMVRAGSEVLIVGVGEHGVNPIRTYGRHEAEGAGLLDQIADDPGDDDGGWTPVEPGGGPADGVSTNGTPAGFSTPSEALRRGVDALRQRTVRR